MSSLQFSHPTPSDIPALAQLWNVAMPPEFPLTERLLRQSMQDDPWYESEGCWIVRDKDAIIGWVMVKSMREAGPEVGRFQNRGGIGALCVHPDYQRRGIGSELLGRAETFLSAHNSPATLLYFPYHLLPGIPDSCVTAIAFFEKHGYGNWKEEFDLHRNLSNYQIPDKALSALQNNPSVEIRPARDDEATKVINFVAREFPGPWTYTTRQHFLNGGFPHDVIIIVDNMEDNSIIGFCHTGDFHSLKLIPSTYWFPALGPRFGGLGPIGIAKAHRKRGLGLALCAVAVNDLKGRGVEEMAIDWTTLRDFYGQMGFEVWKRYLQGERKIC
jgi:GNAT superfamily N-acetyltransferase